MKRALAFFLTLCCCASLFGAARGKTTPPGWYDDFEAAKAKAGSENKPMLLLFTGSDWCGFCIKLRKNALDKSDFKSYAKKHLVLVYIDSPRKTKLPAALVAQNRDLRNKYGSRGVPHTVVLSSDGKVLGRISGCPKNPKDYLKKLQGILKGSAE
ncbi:MAG: thioredoxin family protein [Lentisphaeria bacterium]|nr:thioredoxin family protein [Lentisphaeria bacterium]